MTNLQGDVLHIVDSTGALVVSYSYDPYGKPLTTTGSMAATLGADNPLRYRGYVYDQETGFYYLQSRYYDPTIGRFINADNYVSTGQGFLGHNMFAYCGNNPANRIDQSGARSINFNYEYHDDPAVEFGKWLGDLIYDWLEEKTESDKEKIQSGEVSYVANDSGAHIENSYKIKTPWIMYEFIEDNRGTEIVGSTPGAVWEWCVHNIAYDVFTLLRNKRRANQAAHLDLGATIYDDNHGVFSYVMFVSYFLVSSFTAILDAITLSEE